ncbi:MAG TPA: MotA/TolQ/ExbB proton channel family protein [Candidatus Krumholzibacteria bacterium]|nr:MotA/TolQ/ExbB proton channel family protein [Candidatus Krumholzibacteria bacterium]
MSNFDWIKLMSESPVLVALLCLSVVTVGVSIERFYYFWTRRGNADQIAREVLQHLRHGEMKEAFATCERAKHPAAPIMQVVLGAPVGTTADLDERLVVALSEQKLMLERNLNILGTMAVTAPLVGLLGTVWGIMRAFHDMALVGSAAPTVVAGGIAEALITTAVGLVVAVPSLVGYNHFVRRMNVMLTLAENHARALRTAIIDRGTPEDRGGTRKREEPISRSIRSAAEPVNVG